MLINGQSHLKYTIPPAILLTLIYWPLFTKRDVYRILVLIAIAVLSTIPWDSYLIRSRIWSYPSYAVLGPTVYQIPVEELFFFFIQTYDVSLLYMLYTKAAFYPAFLQAESLNGNTTNDSKKTLIAKAGQAALVAAIVKGANLVSEGKEGTYMGLIVIWAFPFMLMLWSLSSWFALRIPFNNIFVPIVLPTVYLWMVDTFSLKRGTWVIENGTKFGVHLWDGLEIEEAFFFLATNVLIVLGQVAFDNAVAIIDAFPNLFPTAKSCPSPYQAIIALVTPVNTYDSERTLSLQEAINRLRKKSRSFYIASAMFEGRLRIDLVLLYSFCRIADDLVDNAKDATEAQMWISRIRRFLELSYNHGEDDEFIANTIISSEFVQSTFPEQAQRALLQLPVASLSRMPLFDLLNGFDMDLLFSSQSSNEKWPISDERALETYGNYVAGTVAELCCDLVFEHFGHKDDQRRRLKDAAQRMGIALQTVNIARDIQVDAKLGRVYIPTSWLAEEGMVPEDVLQNTNQEKLLHLRSKLLSKAFLFYESSRAAIEELPVEARGPIRVAIESYMEIGRVLKGEGYQVMAGKATVPPLRRIWVAWRALHR